MSELLTVTVWIDPDKPKALDGYRNVLSFLQKHPDVTDEDKMTIYLLDLNSRRTNTLVDIYFGMFKVKEVHAIKNSMTKLLRILLDKIAPTLVTFTLTEQDDEVTLVISEAKVQQEPQVMTPVQQQKGAATEDMDETLERITQYSVASNLMPSQTTATGMEVAPVNQVQAGIATSVASSVTVSARKASSTTSSVNTPQSKAKTKGTIIPNPVTPTVSKKIINENLENVNLENVNVEDVTKMPPASKVTEVGAVMSQESTQVNTDGNLFDLGTMPASDDTEIHKQDIASMGLNRTVIDLTGTPSHTHGNEQRGTLGNSGESEGVTGNIYSSYKEKLVGETVLEEKDKRSKTTSDDFVPVKDGIKVDNLIDTKSAGSKKSENTNSFALLDMEDAEDEDNRKENTEDHDKSTDDDEKSMDLLFPPSTKPTAGSKKNFLQLLHNNIGRTPAKEHERGSSGAKNDVEKKKTTKKEPIPEILKIPDKRLRDHAYAMETIENKIQRKRQNEVSVQDLAWYISSTKPRFGHMKAQLAQDCTTIQREATRNFKKASKETVDFAEMELAKAATIECNKLNNTSFKIMEEMKKVQATFEELKTLHSTCSNLMGPMSVWSTQFITKTESDHKFDHIEKTIASRMDHTEQLLHPLRNAIEVVEKGITPIQQEVRELQGSMQQLKKANGIDEPEPDRTLL